METNDLYVMDTAGKQHKMGIVKTIEGGPGAVGAGADGNLAREFSLTPIRARLVEAAPQRIVDNDDPSVGKGLDRMADIRWDDRD